MTMPAQPPATAVPAPPPGAPGTITVPTPDPAGAFDPRTGDPVAPATDPSGVWSSDVTPAQPPAPNSTVTAPPVVPAVVPAPTATGTPIQPVTVNGTQYFTAEALEEARRQEREKLYGRLEEQGQQLQSVTAFVEEERQRRAQAEQEAAAAAERERQAGLTVEQRMADLEETWRQRMAQQEQTLAMQAAVMEQERRLATVSNYRAKRLQEEQDLIHPTLIDYVIGASEEEIDQSIAAAKAKTDAIVTDMQGQQVAQRQAMRTVAPTGAPPVNPSDTTSGQQTFTAEEIRQWDSATYAKHRAALMQAVSAKAAAGALYQP